MKNGHFTSHDLTTSALSIGNKPEGQGGEILLFVHYICTLYCIVIVFFFSFHSFITCGEASRSKRDLKSCCSCWDNIQNCY